MPIIKGIDRSSVAYNSCRICDSSIEYYSSEIQQFNHINYANIATEQYYVICPKCGNHVNLYSKQN